MKENNTYGESLASTERIRESHALLNFPSTVSPNDIQACEMRINANQESPPIHGQKGLISIPRPFPSDAMEA